MELFPFDDDYVGRLRSGDPATEEHFHSYFRELLLVKLRRRLRSMQAVDDVRQEVFKRVLEHLGELRDARKLGAFVNSTCNLVLLEFYRAESRAESLGEEAEVAMAADADAHLDAARTRVRVRRALENLEPRDAEILRAVFLEEGDKDEICRRYGIDRGYLRVLLHRAKEKFRAQYLRRQSGRLQVVETFGAQSSLQD
ncbi:MAG TPA: sigma-70 family RNA polymerase sigma factor [Thermoanaerobaculia bacterium]|nr:sigma-70 family RNA polymerase sigma factor [Thermoanaerobaculia bacterium]